MKIFLHPSQQKKIFFPLYSCETARLSSSSIPQTGSTGTKFPLIISIYRYLPHEIFQTCLKFIKFFKISFGNHFFDFDVFLKD